MKLKLDGDGHVVLQDGKPVYTGDDGKDIAFDAPGTIATIGRLNGEAKAHREKAEAAENKLKAFEGIEDPSKALEALKTVENLDSKKLVDAGEIETVKAEIAKAFKEQLDAKDTENKKLSDSLHKEIVGGAFARSSYIEESMTIPSDIAQAMFGESFKVEDGQPVAHYKTGDKIFSTSNPGELASPDEALKLLVEQYPNRDKILKGSGASGSGAQESNSSGKTSGNFGGDTSQRVAAIGAKFPDLPER